MTQVKVYRYRAWDQLKGVFIIPDRMATREYISSVRALEILENTEKEIDSSELDGDGKTKNPF